MRILFRSLLRQCHDAGTLSPPLRLVNTEYLGKDNKLELGLIGEQS